MNCKECLTEFYVVLDERMRAQQLCLYCLFWTTLIGAGGLVIGGRHYQVGDEGQRGNRRWRGFGGAAHFIITDDEKLICTTNLWTQGEIPARFRDRFPDNARFITREEWQRHGSITASIT